MLKGTYLQTKRQHIDCCTPVILGTSKHTHNESCDSNKVVSIKNCKLFCYFENSFLFFLHISDLSMSYLLLWFCVALFSVAIANRYYCHCCRSCCLCCCLGCHYFCYCNYRRDLSFCFQNPFNISKNSAERLENALHCIWTAATTTTTEIKAATQPT